MHPAVIVFFVVAAIAPAQTSRPDSRPASDPKAVELFKKALAAQTDGGPPILIKDFQADLQVVMYETDPKTKERRMNSATVKQSYLTRGKDEPLFRRALLDSVQGNETIQGYDGTNWWQRLGNAPPRDLSRGRENADDKKRIHSEINRTREYLRFLLLSNLDGPDVTFDYAGETTVKADRKERKVERIVRHHPKELPIDLFIGDSKGTPVLYGFSRKLDTGTLELITFCFHTLVKSPGGSALVPLVAEYFEGPDHVPTFEARASKATDIKFNSGLDEKFFAMPTK